MSSASPSPSVHRNSKRFSTENVPASPPLKRQKVSNHSKSKDVTISDAGPSSSAPKHSEASSQIRQSSVKPEPAKSSASSHAGPSRLQDVEMIAVAPFDKSDNVQYVRKLPYGLWASSNSNGNCFSSRCRQKIFVLCAGRTTIAQND